VTSVVCVTDSAPSLDHLDPYRLPTTARPERYDLRLEPDLEEGTFVGRVDITVIVDEPLDALVLNADELHITGAWIDGDVAALALEGSSERIAVMSPAGHVPVGRRILRLEFAGVLNDKLRGFYRSTFVDGDGQQRVIATTQMQPTDCRRAFPCWDEPEFKAVFGITLVVPQDLMAISNGPEVARSVLDDDRVEVRFADTMPMSTYLVAFVVGPLEATPAVDVDGVPVRVVHLPGKDHLTGFGLDIATRALRWFTSYYGIPYADQKIDLVAVPDFAAGAMENTGCITFRENLLLVDPATATLSEQMLVADVICHELAHMWFGNLVTMRWWNGIWLNEAFATFMEVASCDDLQPEWRRWDVFSLERTMAFDTDSLTSTRSIEYPVHSPEDCEGMFDVLTYNKGGAILRMLQQYLGEDRFRDGVRLYLDRHRFANTETGDLWDAIEEAIGGDEPVRELMDSWIWQPGYPLVSAHVEGDELVLTQDRFAFGVAGGHDQQWLAPVHLRVGQADSAVLLRDEPVRVRLSDPEAPVVVNAGGHGFLRVAYSPDLLARLSGTLSHLTPVERYAMVDDAWNAVVAGRGRAVDLLDLLRRFGDERDLAVWQSVVAALSGLSRLVTGDASDALAADVRAILSPALERLGWEPADGESEREGRLRGLLVAALATIGRDSDVVERCRQVFADTAQSDANIHPELVAAATTAVAANGDSSTFDALVAGFRSAPTPQEEIRHLYALAELPDADLLRRVCELAVSGEVRTQNAPFLLNLCIANRRHGAVAWTFVRDNWQYANEHFPVNTIARMVTNARLLDTAELVDDVHEFFAHHRIPQAEKTLEQILERQRVNAALRVREAVDLTAHLG
jgi:puromycin-sensitive aminopeptidase